MILLIAGVVLFSLAHLAHRVMPGLCALLPVLLRKVLVAVMLVLSIWMMGRGYSEASADVLWTVPQAVRMVAIFLMAAAFILFFSTHPGAALSARMRHPQLTGFKLWAILHTLVNGDVRSVVLFGGLLIWAILSVIIINKQTGKPPLPAESDNSLKAWMAVPLGLAVWVAVFAGHEWLFGVSPIG